MQTRTKQTVSVPVADIEAVREFLISGREVPPAPKPARPATKSHADVPFHHGIVRARARSASKG